MKTLVDILTTIAAGLMFGVLLSLAVSTCHAREFKLLEVQEVSIDYKSFMRNGNSPYMTNGSTLNKEVDLNINTDFLRYFYVNNRVWSLVDQHQFRWVGLNAQIGARLTSFLDIGFEHFSQHTLDRQYYFKDITGDRFPVYDAITLKIYLFKRDPRDTIFSF